MSNDQYEGYLDNDQDEWPVGVDCDDTNPFVHPGAPDFRGDGCDADCGAEGDGEIDSDGDDWPDGADCDPNDPTIYPCAPETLGDNINSDCGEETADDPYGDGLRSSGCVALDPDAVSEGIETPQLTASCQAI